MPSTTKERILESTAELFRRQGYTGTGMKQIAAEASAPFGSVYHFFPGGKEELGAETIRTSGRLYTQLFASIAVEAPDVLSAVREFFAGAGETLRETDYADACPIATVALEVASTNEPLRMATAEVFEEWIDGATAYFEFAGIARPRARELALMMLSLL
jgi:AcrR family transcriptional regulator